jgi:hypothetical protein
MGWLGRITSVRTLKSDINQAKTLPEAQRVKLSSEMGEFIEEIRSVMCPVYVADIRKAQVIYRCMAGFRGD